MGTIIVWYLCLLLIGGISFPIVSRIFKGLPDKGYSFSRTFGLLLFTYIFWLLCSLGFSANNISGVLFSLLAVGGISLKIYFSSKYRAHRKWIKTNLSYLVSSEIIFVVSFLVFAWFKAHNPDIFGTEKPMEYMFINSIRQSLYFPAHDAWLSGYGISYYHFGYIIIAALAKLTGTSSSIAFNLGLISIFSLSAQCGFGLANNLISKARWGSRSSSIPSLNSSILPSLLAPMLILVVGNLYGVLDVLHNNGILADAKIPAIIYDYPNGASVNDINRSSRIAFKVINVWDWLDIKRLSSDTGIIKDTFDWNTYNWFFASRILHDRDLSGSEVEVIDEFPAFSFLLGDLHPHILSLPFVILTMGYAFSFLNDLNERPLPILISIRDIQENYVLFVMIGLFLGGLSFLNFWDFPIYFFIILLVYIVSLIKNRLKTDVMIRSIVIFTFSAIGSSILLYFPFYISFQSQAGGILPNIMFPTRTHQFLLHIGPLLFLSFLFVIWLYRNSRKRIKFRTVMLASILLVAGLTLITVLLSGFLYYALDISIVQSQLGGLSLSQTVSYVLQKRFVSILTPSILAILFGLAVALLVGKIRPERFRAKTSSYSIRLGTDKWDRNGGNEPSCDSKTSLIFVLILLITSVLLLIGPEFLYLGDNFGTRMNTVFKFYYQAWIQLGIIGAFSLWFLSNNGGAITKALARVSGIVIILLGLFYTSLTANTIAGPYQREKTLDGMEYFSMYYPDDWNVIEWLNEYADSGDVLLEGTMGAYWVEGRSSRISMGTGLQTVMGWANHEAQWRGADFSSVAGRLDDIRVIYQTSNWDEAERLLSEYNVKFVVVSPLENQWYGPINTHKFDKNLVEVFRSGDTIIYQRTDWR